MDKVIDGNLWGVGVVDSYIQVYLSVCAFYRPCVISVLGNHSGNQMPLEPTVQSVLAVCARSALPKATLNPVGHISLSTKLD